MALGEGDRTAVITLDTPEKVDITSESFQNSVKGDLELIVLALVLKQPMCGTDLIKAIHSKFGLLLSPGTIYPLLHGLEDRELLRRDSGAKTKTYRPVEGAEKKIRDMLEDQVRTWRVLSQFLRDTR